MANQQDEMEALRAQLAALTVRIYQLEQRAGIEPQKPVATLAATPVQPVPPASQPPSSRSVQQVPPPSFTRPVQKKEKQDLEKKIGQYWLNRIGIVAVLFGASYFLKYAIDNAWIGPAGQIAIGLLAGIAIILWSERFRKHGHAPFSYSLKAVGIGILYLSLWAAFQVYHLIPAEAAFGAMIIVTGSTIAMALSQDAELLAAFALIGGFSTPILLSTGQNREIVLFSYVALLNLAVLVMARIKPWRRLSWLSFAGTVVLFWGWGWGKGDFYSDDLRAVTTAFAALFGAIFASIPLVAPFSRSTRFKGPSITLTLLPLLNAANFFLALYVMYREEKVTLAISALVLAAAYLGISSAFKRHFSGEEGQVINLLHIAIAIAFITIAIPLKAEKHWITMGWLVESAALLWIAVKTKTDFLRYLAVTILVLGVVRLLVWDEFDTHTLVFNARFATYLIAIAVLGGIVYFGGREAGGKERPFIRLAGIALNLLALVALTGEAANYFHRQEYALYQIAGYNTDFRQLRLAHRFTFSAICLLYGAGLMALGFWKRIAFVRWQALVLIAFTIGKVFLYDTSELEKGYRILSFLALGVVLLGVSFIYQRDWLKLSPRSSEKSPETSA